MDPLLELAAVWGGVEVGMYALKGLAALPRAADPKIKMSRDEKYYLLTPFPVDIYFGVRYIKRRMYGYFGRSKKN